MSYSYFPTVAAPAAVMTDKSADVPIGFPFGAALNVLKKGLKRKKKQAAQNATFGWFASEGGSFSSWLNGLSKGAVATMALVGGILLWKVTRI